MSRRRERLRWWIAYQLNRLPGQCWADIVFWVFRDNGRTLPWSPISPGCKQDFLRTGTCYCGTLRDDTDPGKRVLRREIRRVGNRCDCPVGDCLVSAMSPLALMHHVEQSHRTSPRVWPQDYATDITWHGSPEVPNG